MTTGRSCPFCALIDEGNVVLDRGLAVVVEDAYPISRGHSLVVPRRHEADFFALTPDERTAMLDAAVDLHASLGDRYEFDGVNLGLNNGPAAGQTVDHVHLHVIPRYQGDVADPRGGVRWIMPNKAAYWAI